MTEENSSKNNAVLSTEELQAAFETEGLEYTLLDYYSIERFPSGLREKVGDLRNAMSEIETWLEDNGVEYGL